MNFQKQYTPISDPLRNDSAALSCPLLNIPRIDEHGMVLESQCGFEIGSTIALGFHLLNTDSFTEQTAQYQQNPQDKAFISVEAIVVESKIGSGSTGQPVHLVTILFSLISRKDREQLLRYSDRYSGQPQPKPSLAAHHSAPPCDYHEKLHRDAPRCIYLN